MEKEVILVFGSGVAGLSISMHREEGLLFYETEESSSLKAQGGIAVAIHKDDSPKLHFDDTMRVGEDLCNKEAVKILVNEGKKLVLELMKMGLEFDKEEGVRLGMEGGHSKSRILHIEGDHTGKHFTKFLLGQSLIERRKGRLLELIKRKDEIKGAIVEKKGEVEIYFGNAVIATGGCSALYSETTNPPNNMGEGIAIAYESGAEMESMEFLQFHPTVYKSFLISEAMRGEGAKLVNDEGKRFIDELRPRDVVSRAIFQQKGTFLDARAIPPERFPQVFGELKRKGIDFTKELVPVEPSAHYFIGGIKTGLRGQTNLKNLFAVGECASTGVHGANRLASNSLLEGLVFGKRVGKLKFARIAIDMEDKGIAEEAKEKWESILEDEKLKLRDKEELKEGREAYEEFRLKLWENLGIIRYGSRMGEFVDYVKSMEKNELLSTKERRGILLAKLMVESALAREESRGCHFRKDFSEKKKEFEKTIMKKIQPKTGVHEQ